LQAVADDLAQYGATIVALTPQLPEYNAEMSVKNTLNFHLLSDPGNAYAAELGLRFEVPGQIKEVYSGFGLNLPKFNGDDTWTLPIPARIVVDTSGIVRMADIDADYTSRPEPSKTVADVTSLA
jgi:peroxiredoxin